jgi:hypothetical protein
MVYDSSVIIRFYPTEQDVPTTEQAMSCKNVDVMNLDGLWQRG